MNGNDVVIVGGGTSAWITAILFYESNPTLNIVVIHSDKINTVGVGESTTPMFYNFINTWTRHINEKDFLHKTKSTIKMGVVHQGWKGNEDVFFNPIDSVNHVNDGVHPFDFDYLRTYCVANNLPLDINYESICIKNGIIPYTKEKNNLIKKGNYAYHLNVQNTINYLRDVSLKLGIMEINGRVIDTKKNYLVEEIILDNGDVVKGDFFIDCMGQHSIFQDLYDNKWIDKSPSGLDSAVIYQVEDNDTKTYTLSKATKDGWEWKIPQVGYRNCGYLFNSNITCTSRVQEELKSNTLVKFKSGIIKKFLNRNILHVGLSSGFVEPLEATSLHISLIQVKTFIDKFYRKGLSYPNYFYEKSYNKQISLLWDSTFDWIRLHYINVRQDSIFWKEVTNIPMSDEIINLLEIYKYRMPRLTDYNHNEIYQTSLIFHVLGGMGILNSGTAKLELDYYNLNRTAENEYQKLINDNIKFTSNLITHDSFLNNIHNIYN